MMTAKARGKIRIGLFDDEGPSARRPLEPAEGRHALDRAPEDAAESRHKLNRLNEAARSAARSPTSCAGWSTTTTAACSSVEGDDLVPVAFRGDLRRRRAGPLERAPSHGRRTASPAGSRRRASRSRGDAANCEFALPIPGTAEIEESLLAVPLRYGSRAIGVVVVSKLGLDQFDADDLRLLEVLAGHAAVALENASPLRGAAARGRAANALLEFGRELSSPEAPRRHPVERVAEGSARLLARRTPPSGCRRDREATRAASAARVRGARRATSSSAADAPASSRAFIAALQTPFVVGPEEYAEFIGDALSGGGRDLRGRTVRRSTAARARSPSRRARRALRRARAALLGGLAHQAKLAIRTPTQLRVARADVPVDRRGARERARGERRVHVLARALDHRPRAPCRRRAGSRRHALKRARAGRALPRHRQDRHPDDDPLEARTAHRRSARLIETHPALGERILAPIDRLEDVRADRPRLSRALRRRRLPDQLAGEDIPIEARIILACDAFHAMTTDRPYRALPAEEALRRLRGSRRHPSSTPVSSTSACGCSGRRRASCGEGVGRDLHALAGLAPRFRSRSPAARLGDPPEDHERAAFDRNEPASREDRRSRLYVRLGGRELVRPAAAVGDRRHREGDRLVVRVEEDQEGVVHHRLAASLLSASRRR